MSLKRKEIFEFGEFRLDVSEHTVERIDGTRNGTLTEKSFQVLVRLVQRRGHLVTKDELIEFVWPDTIVEDNNLEKCIHHLRHFLGERPEGTKYIETVRKHGYRFIGNVEMVEVSSSWLPETFRTIDEPGETHLTATLRPANAEAALGPDPVGPTSKIPFVRRNSITIYGAIAVLIGVLVFLGYYSFIRSGFAADERRSIAVLPLRPIDPANRSDLYENGIADSLIQRLHSIKGLFVRPLTDMRKYTEVGTDPLAAGREQKVDYVLASNYQIADGRIKVTSQLLDVLTGKVEDTFTIATDAASLFSAEDAIANDIGNKLLAKFGSAGTELQAKRGTNNEEAYRSYLQAMNIGEERGIQNLFKALEYVDRSVALDPNYALAWAAQAHIHEDIVGHTDADQAEHYQRSMEAIEKALAIDPNLSEAYSALCNYKNTYEYNVVGAETACKRAVELDPKSPVAHKTYAKFLYSRGRFEQAIVEIKAAIDIQPVSYRNQQIYALTLYYARRYEEAEAQFKRLIELNPNQTNFVEGRLVKVLEQQGKDSEAFEYLVRSLISQKADKETLERYKTAFRTSGWRGAVMEQIKTAESNPDPGYFQLACMHAKIGNKDKAFEYLEKAFGERSFQISVLQVEPQFDALRSDPRFADLTRRVEGK